MVVTVLLVLGFLATAGDVFPQQKKGAYSLGSFHTGTSQYIYAGMLAGLARTHAGMDITNEATGGTTENLDLLRRGETELGNVSPERLYSAFHGTGKYEGKQTPVGILWAHGHQMTLLFVKQSSPIKSFRDLKGKKVAIGPAGSSNEIKNSFVLEAYGYTRKEKGKFDFNELQTVKLSYPEAANALAEGVTDATIATQPAPDPSHAELALRIPLRVIPLDQDMFGAVKKIYPWLWPITVPAGTYRGQEQELMTLGDPNYIIAHLTNFPEKAAYDLTKAYIEKILPQIATQFETQKPYAKDKRLNVNGFVIPAHPGALKYYTEIGLKPEVMK
jgi:TRAP transporter TAXI family solute receptor